VNNKEIITVFVVLKKYNLFRNDC